MWAMPRTASRMPDQRKPSTDAEHSQIQYNHDKSKQIHSHQQSGLRRASLKCKSTKGIGCLLDPNENRLADLDQAD